MKFRLLLLLLGWIVLSIAFFALHGLYMGFSVKLAILCVGAGFLGSLAALLAAWLKNGSDL